jgi:gamma-glutamylcyclotransferase (GGCT)/AIG2-like uncharacterized protein YtfP/quinol monooxygenase YgiN
MEGAFREELLRVIGPSRDEVGCLRIDVFETIRELVEFAIHSEWVDEAAFELHTRLPHTTRFITAAEKLLGHPVQGLRMHQIGGGLGRALDRLAVYGTLAPGRVNHHHLAELKGHWQRGTVQGKLIDAGWGSALGFPGLILDPSGPPVEVYLFESSDLPDYWSRLDEFEGPGYRRVVTEVHTIGGKLSAHIYVVAT